VVHINGRQYLPTVSFSDPSSESEVPLNNTKKWKRPSTATKANKAYQEEE